jgi:hypothetical protein
MVRVAIVAAVALLVNFSGVRAVLAAPTDIVPRGDVAYDLLGSLASAGRLPGYTLRDFARGDRLYTRSEMAHIIAQIPEEDSAIDEPDRSFAATERVLRSEFATELKLLGSAVAPNSATPAKVGAISGQIKARALTGPAAGTGTLRFAATLPIGRDGYAVLSGSNYRYEWYDPSMPGASTATRPNQHFDYPAVETAFVRENGRFLDVSVGKMPLRWGPGYVGGMMLSDDAATIPQIRVEKEFSLWGWLGRQLGPMYFTQLQGIFQEDDIPTAPPNARGTERYLGGRRIESAGDSRWHVAISEGFKSTRLPDPLLVQVLPYYLYQNELTENSRRRFFPFLFPNAEPNTNWFNYVADVNTSYRTDRHGTTVYADLFLDDLKAPSGLGITGSDTPRKIGQQYGIHVPDLGGVKRYGLRLELTLVDPGTYTNISPPVAWSEGGVPLGFPSGPNADTLFGRFDTVVTDRIQVALEGQTRRSRSTTATSVNQADIDRLGLYGSYALRRNAFVAARYEWEKMTQPALPQRKLSRFEVNAAIGF